MFEENFDYVDHYVQRNFKPSDFTDDPDAPNQLSDLIKKYISSMISEDELSEKSKLYLNNCKGFDTVFDKKRLLGNPIETKIINNKNTKPWSPEEDQKLAQAISIFGASCWTKISEFIGGTRTQAQCSQRWNRVINPQISRSGWTFEEEEKLLNLVEKFGDRKWSKIAHEMGNRCDVQCRFKYKLLMNKKKNQKYLCGIINA